MNIKDFKNGWFIGKFEPSLLKQDFEVGLRWNQMGATVPRHYHKMSSEYVVFAGGKHRLNDEVFEDGDMKVINPYMSSEYECLEPGYCLTVRDCSVPDDKFVGSSINVVIPMAGKGQRFKDAGFRVPKPLIELNDRAMIDHVGENVTPRADHRFIFISRTDVDLSHTTTNRRINTLIHSLDHETEGAVSTMLEVEHLIGREDPVIIANCDQLITGFDVDDFMDKAEDCSVAVFKSQVPHHSYVKVEEGLVTEVAEKQVISDLAVCGIYFYRKSKYFFDGAKEMIKKNIRVNGEFYNSPVFNEIIANGLKVNVYEVPKDKQHNIGTPDELKVFQAKLDSGEVVL